MLNQNIVTAIAREYADLGIWVGGGNLPEIVAQIKIQGVFAHFLQMHKMGAFAKTQQGFNQADRQHFVHDADKQPNMRVFYWQFIQILWLDVFKIYEQVFHGFNSVDRAFNDRRFSIGCCLSGINARPTYYPFRRPLPPPPIPATPETRH